MGFFVPAESNIGHGVVGLDFYNRDIKPVRESPGGQLGLLTSSPVAEGLSDAVEIHAGNFTEAPILDYNFIFSDIAHSIAEIDAALPHLRRLVCGRKVVFCRA
jgi:hypothetical protein